MKNTIITLVAALVMVMTPSMAQANPYGYYYGQSAAAVAKEIGCKNFTRTGPALFSKDGGICYLKGYRVNIKTYKNLSQQIKWDMTVKDVYDRNFYWASGLGAAILAKNGSRAAAVVGDKALGAGQVYHG